MTPSLKLTSPDLSESNSEEGFDIDLSNYFTKDEINTLISNVADKI